MNYVESHQLKRLCRRHRARFLWASVMDGVPSELAAASPDNRRSRVLDEAMACAQCRALTEHHVTPGGPIWNPTTVGTEAIADPPSTSPGWTPAAISRRPGPTVDIGWVIVGVMITALALAGVGTLTWSMWHDPVGHRSLGETATDAVDGLAEPGERSDWVEYADLKVGDCVRGLSADEEGSPDLRIVACEKPHNDEVYGTFVLPDQEWPGDDRVADLSWQGCDRRFEAYVRISVDETALDSYINPPVDIGWPEDRVVVCTVAEGETLRTGSLKGAER